MAIRVKVTAVPFGPIETGIWCHVCLKSSVIRQKFALQAGLSILGYTPPYEWCIEHEQQVQPQ